MIMCVINFYMGDADTADSRFHPKKMGNMMTLKFANVCNTSRTIAWMGR